MKKVWNELTEETKYRKLREKLDGTHYVLKKGKKQPESDISGEYVRGYAIFDCAIGFFVEGFDCRNQSVAYSLDIEEAKQLVNEYKDK